MKTDVSYLLERQSSHEERCGVSFEALYAELQDNDGEFTVYVRGELHSDGNLRSSLDVRANAYNAAGQVIGTGSAFIDDSSFLDFETIEIGIYDLLEQPGRILLYPKPI